MQSALRYGSMAVFVIVIGCITALNQ